jgi:hypothetical protein
MVKLRYVQILLEKNERFSTPLSVAPWEVPVLIEAHSGSAITDLGTMIVKRKQLPVAADEFARLQSRYKHSGDSAVPYVARVFGVGAQGVRAIDQMIQAALVGGESDAGDAAVEVDQSADADLARFVAGDGAEEGPQAIAQ